MRPEEVLGLPLDKALRRWTEAGLAIPAIRETADPKGARTDGTLRVVRVKEGEWVVARFYDGVPKRPEPKESEQNDHACI